MPKKLAKSRRRTKARRRSPNLWQRTRSWLLKNEPPAWLLLTFLAVIILRLPSLSEPFRYADENIYLTLGNALKKGLVFYRDIHDNKPPLLYLLAALTGSVFWFRFLLLILSLVWVYFFHLLSLLLFPKKPKIAQLATLLFALLTSIPLLEGNIANSEIFMIGPTIIAFYLLLSIKSPGHASPQLLAEAGLPTEALAKAGLIRYFTVGLLLSLAVLLKVPAIFDTLVIPLFLLADIKFNRPATWKNWAIKNLSLATGILTPLGLSFLYYASQNALSPYLTAAFLQNFGYLSSWSHASPAPFLVRNAGLLTRLGLATAITALLIFLKSKKTLAPPPLFVLLWFTWSTFAAFLSQRPYPHYLIQILPALCLTLAWLILTSRPAKLIALPLLTLLLAGLVRYHFYYGATYPYYANFIKLVTRRLSQDEYLATFGDKYPSRYRLAQYIQNTTSPDDKIFVWGTDPEIYALTRRLPVGRYTVSYHIFDFAGQEETLTALKRTPPRYIIVTGTEPRPWSEFFNFLFSSYYPLTSFGDATVYWHPNRQSLLLH